jgi:hypothetical protein
MAVHPNIQKLSGPFLTPVYEASDSGGHGQVEGPLEAELRQGPCSTDPPELQRLPQATHRPGRDPMLAVLLVPRNRWSQAGLVPGLAKAIRARRPPAAQLGRGFQMRCRLSHERLSRQPGQIPHGAHSTVADLVSPGCSAPIDAPQKGECPVGGRARMPQPGTEQGQRPCGRPHFAVHHGLQGSHFALGAPQQTPRLPHGGRLAPSREACTPAPHPAPLYLRTPPCPHIPCNPQGGKKERGWELKTGPHPGDNRQNGSQNRRFCRRPQAWHPVHAMRTLSSSMFCTCPRAGPIHLPCTDPGSVRGG